MGWGRCLVSLPSVICEDPAQQGFHKYTEGRQLLSRARDAACSQPSPPSVAWLALPWRVPWVSGSPRGPCSPGVPHPYPSCLAGGPRDHGAPVVFALGLPGEWLPAQSPQGWGEPALQSVSLEEVRGEQASKCLAGLRNCRNRTHTQARPVAAFQVDPTLPEASCVWGPWAGPQGVTRAGGETGQGGRNLETEGA